MSDADYWNKLNEDCENRSGQAAGYCQRSWGYGGPEAQWRMRQFADWLEDLYNDILELIEANCLYEDTFEACMQGCADILELDVEHDRHLKYIVRIRYAIHSEGSWDDWPYDISDLLESEDSESGAIFRMDI